MSNDPKSDLIYALLTMDSYNRGYGTGITDLKNNINVSNIGNFTIFAHSDDRVTVTLYLTPKLLPLVTRGQPIGCPQQCS